LDLEVLHQVDTQPDPVVSEVGVDDGLVHDGVHHTDHQEGRVFAHPLIEDIGDEGQEGLVVGGLGGNVVYELFQLGQGYEVVRFQVIFSLAR